MSRKILLIRLSSLGDLVILSSVLELLKGNEVYLATYSHFAGLYGHDSRLRGIIKIPKPYGLSDIVRIVKEIRSQNFDYVFDLQRKVLSIILVGLSGATHRAFYDNRRRERLRALRTKQIKEVPVYELYAAPIKKALGIDLPTPCPKLESVPIELELPERYVVVAPGAKHETKVWPYFGEFVRMFKEKFPEIEVVAVGGKEDRRFLNGFSGQVIDMVGRTTIPGLLKVIEKSKLVVSNDSAPMHIGAAYGVPTIGIFGPTVPEFGFRPCNARIIEVKGLECRPCSLHGSTACPLKHFKCMRNIKPETVLKAAEEMVEYNF